MQAKRPDVIAYVTRHAAAGVGFGTLFATALLWLDVAGLRSLLMRPDDWGVALALLYAGFGVTFGSAVSGTAIMLIGDSDEAFGPR